MTFLTAQLAGQAGTAAPRAPRQRSAWAVRRAVLMANTVGKVCPQSVAHDDTGIPQGRQAP